MEKRLFSLILCPIMVPALLPAGVLAAAGDAAEVWVAVCR